MVALTLIRLMCFLPADWFLVLFGSWQRHRGLLTGWIPEAKLSLAAFDSPVGRTDWKRQRRKETESSINNLIYVSGQAKPL